MQISIDTVKLIIAVNKIICFFFNCKVLPFNICKITDTTHEITSNYYGLIVKRILSS